MADDIIKKEMAEGNDSSGTAASEAPLQKKESVKKETPEKKSAKEEKKSGRTVDPKVWNVINYLLLTEKCVRLIEQENKLVFAVDRKYGKGTIRKAVESMLNAKVVSVNTLIDRRGRKKAYVKLSKETNAMDVATRFGML